MKETNGSGLYNLIAQVIEETKYVHGESKLAVEYQSGRTAVAYLELTGEVAPTARIMQKDDTNYIAAALEVSNNTGKRQNGGEIMIRKYNKLVRNRIPEIIEASGKTCVTKILSDEDYLQMLDAKLDEELAEYHKDQNIEELADLMEVIHAAAIARGYTLEQLEQVRTEKAAKRGGFENKILLKEVAEK